MTWRDIYAEQNLEMANEMLQQQGQINELRKQTAAVRKLHSRYRGPTDPDSCAECNRLAGFEIRWPCPTIAALDAAGDQP